MPFLFIFLGFSQLSYADTHPMFTKENYPNFYRIVPSENELNPARVRLLLHFNWTKVGTLYQNEPRYSLVSWNKILHNFVAYMNVVLEF